MTNLIDTKTPTFKNIQTVAGTVAAKIQGIEAMIEANKESKASLSNAFGTMVFRGLNNGISQDDFKAESFGAKTNWPSIKRPVSAAKRVYNALKTGVVYLPQTETSKAKQVTMAQILKGDYTVSYLYNIIVDASKKAEAARELQFKAKEDLVSAYLRGNAVEEEHRNIPVSDLVKNMAVAGTLEDVTAKGQQVLKQEAKKASQLERANDINKAIKLLEADGYKVTML